MGDEDLLEDGNVSDLHQPSADAKGNRSIFLSASEYFALPKCSGCQRQLPYPINLPENHPVISLEDVQALERIRMVTSLSGVRSGAVKTWNGTAVRSSAGVKPRAGPAVHPGGYTSNISLNNHRISTMGDDIPVFPKARSMFIHSGNIINWNRLKRKLNQTSTEEVCECIAQTLACYLEAEDKTNLQYVTEIYKVNSENVQKIDDSEREEVKITVKVFVCLSQPASVISEAVHKVLNELGTSYIETLLLAVGPVNEDDDSSTPSVKAIQPYWEAMEELVAAEKVLSLGVCDLTKDSLEDLYNWAKVKPSVDQVNLESCCVMPQDLTEYAKAVNVQLLTHNDRPVFIPQETLQETIQSVSSEPDSLNWVPQWVVRYSGILKCRGIIKMKGYIVHARREHKKILP